MTSASAKRLVRAIERHGILLLHDATLPSATTLVAGEPVAGSWWSHPKAHEIYDALQVADADATRVKLVNEKVTFVHRRLWAALVAVGHARSAWQVDGLSPQASEAVAAVARRRAPVPVGEVVLIDDRKQRQRVVKEIETRLLAHSTSVHTEAGSHAKHLESWSAFRRRHGLAADGPRADRGRALLEDEITGWRATKPVSLPWTRAAD